MVKIKAGFTIRAENTYAKQRRELAYRIAPSPFEFKDNYDNQPCLDYNNYSIDYSAINIKDIIELSRDLPTKSFNLALQLYYLLEPNTNILRFNISVIYALYSKSKDPAVYSYFLMRPLIDYGLLVKTNQQSTYVVNHNYLFKGSLNQFKKDYESIYGDFKGSRNEAGHLIINNYNISKDTKSKDEDRVKSIINANIRGINYGHITNLFGFSDANKDNNTEQD